MSNGFNCCDFSFIWTWSSKWACGVEVWNHMRLKVKGLVPRSPQNQRGQAEHCLPRQLPELPQCTLMVPLLGKQETPRGKKYGKKKIDCVFSAQIYSLGPRMLEQLCFLLISLDHRFSAHFRTKSVIFTLLLCVIIFPTLCPVQFRATASAVCKCQLNAHQAFTCNK